MTYLTILVKSSQYSLSSDGEVDVVDEYFGEGLHTLVPSRVWWHFFSYFVIKLIKICYWIVNNVLFIILRCIFSISNLGRVERSFFLL